MLHKFLRKITGGGDDWRVSPESFDDPVAVQTNWSPIKRGGTNFRTCRLVQVSLERMEFKASTGAKLFALAFTAMGIFVPAMFIAGMLKEPEGGFRWEAVIPIGIGGIFAGLGVFMFIRFTRPVVFDKVSGYFWKGRKGPGTVLGPQAAENMKKLEEIHALQIVREWCTGNKSSYYSYELNLVFHDGSRENVADHGNLQKLVEDAERLGGFLGVPVWNVFGN